MKKTSTIMAILALIILLITGCGNTISGTVSSRKDSKTAEVLKGEEKYYRNIFASIENGAYSDAEELIQKSIIGNIQNETDAERVCLAYSDALYDDYNSGTASEEEISTICQTASMTSLANNICDSEWNERYYSLQISKANFIQAEALAQEGNYADAEPLLCGVIFEDSNYSKAIKIHYDIAVSFMDSAELDDLKLAVSAFDAVMKAKNNPDYSSEDIDVSSVENQYLTTKHKFAQALEADCQYYYALQQYAQLKFIYSANSEDYDSLVWKLNQNCYYNYNKPKSIDYYEINQNDGTVTKHGEEMIWNIGGSNIAQVSYNSNDSYYGTILGVLYRNGGVEVSLGKSVSNDEAYSAQDMAANEKGITWIKAYYRKDIIGLVGLRCDGTVAICGSMVDDYDIPEMASWQNIIKLLPWGDGYLGLTTDGRVLQTSSVHEDFSGWIEVISICRGSMRRDFDDYKSKGAVFGLTKQGDVLHTEYYDTIDQIGDAVSIAAEFYLSSDGVIHSVSAQVEELLNQNYGDMKFELLVNNTCVYEGETAMAYTTDGRWIVIDV